MNNKEIKAQVMDLLNQIIILTNDIKEPESFEDADYRSHYLTSDVVSDYDLTEDDVDLSKVDDEQVYLYCVGQYAKRVINGKPSSASYNETQYYNSNCY